MPGSITAPGEPSRNPDDAAEQARARDAALSLLAVRARSRGELAERLRRKGFGNAAVSAVLERLAAVGLIDDVKFAESLVRDRLRAGRRGTTAIHAELRRRHVASDTAQEVLARVMADEDVAEDSICLAAAQKWLRTHPDDDARRRRRRLAAFLGRRGFSADAVRGALQLDDS
ncbi:MAG TPA: regulatory protein RecX [Longimicrobiales bacterium]|nr:regulatory protein RecX [Longimicrobiales bacterium]